MKTLKQIIAEAKGLKESWRRDVEGGIESAYGAEDESPRTKEEISKSGPHPSTEKMMKSALAGVKYKRFIPKGTKMDNPDKPVTKLYKVKERKKSK